MRRDSQVSSVEQDAWVESWGVVREQLMKTAAILPAMTTDEQKAFVATLTDAMTSHAYALAIDAKVEYEVTRNRVPGLD